MKIGNKNYIPSIISTVPLKMTTSAPAYPKLQQEPKQEATNPPTYVPVKLDIEVGTNNTNSDDTKATVLGIVYILVLTYASISIFFSIIFGIIGFGFAYYAWLMHANNGSPKISIISAVISFLLSTLSYLTPVVLIILLTQNIISVRSLSF